MPKSRIAQYRECEALLGSPHSWTLEPRMWKPTFVVSVESSSLHLEDAVARFRIGTLEREVRELRSRVEQSERAIIVPILTFAPAPFEVLSPIHVVAQSEEGVYLATFFDANVNASGESQTEAVECLKDMLIAKFRLFCKKEDVLGEEPRRQLGVLRQFMRAL